MTSALPNAEPAPQKPALVVPRRAATRVKVIDALAALVIRLGGTAVIVAVLAIFFFIGRETLPLFQGARSRPLQNGQWPAPAARPPALVGLDEYETYAYALDPADATLKFLTVADWRPHTNLPLAGLSGHPVSTAYRTPSRDHLYIGTTDGHVFAARVRFRVDYADSGRQVTPYPAEARLVRVSESGSAVRAIHGRVNESSGVEHFAVALTDGKLLTVRLEEGEDPKLETVGGELAGQVTHVAIDEDGRKLFAATDAGNLYHWYLEDNTGKPYSVVPPEDRRRRIAALDYVIGNNALLLGFSDGSVEEWFGVRDKPDDVLRPFRKIRSFEPMPAAVTALQPSGRDKGFLVGDGNGNVRLYFTTSGRTLLTRNAGGEVRHLVYAPKLTSVLASTAAGAATLWQVDNPHPEISWQTLFGKVWYEGHDKPKYEWQSTGGSDDFESKFSLVPLTLGTLKGAFYGLLFAIPVAVTAALYTSQFMHYRTRALVKPTVEIMAALPSVVIGFLAGLWLAPALENHVVSVATMLIVIPVFVLLASILWHRLPQGARTRIPHGVELAVIIPVVALGFLVSVKSGPLLEDLFFRGDFKQWVFNVFGEQFEQRNSIVIGFAMGFAVIPIIFTISEDALSNVPQHFISGSLALGASRWQTATRIILPTASPGIFSAIMIGFGRAVGETMIVLMATGNTPILSFSPFNGMRTLSANIAVEIPEAPVGGTLYRVLFLAAMLLFALTFLVNTIAEVVRQRLRERYRAV